jgi:CheY-like chemotaxis protein/two-component sensor histidine kinase
MFVAVLSNRSHSPEDTVLIKRIDDSVGAVDALLNSLLDVSKLEAGLVVPVLASFDIAPLFSRLAAEFQPLATEVGLGFHLVTSHALIRSDPALLERILRNLLNNAVRYTKQGRILLGCRRRRETLVIEVWDTGIGIPGNQLKSIFREFHQLGNSARDRRQGLGLGLAIVDRLAQLLSHRIDVVSEPEKGSVFSIEVPLAKVPAVIAQPKQLTLGIRDAKATILVIEDEPDVLESTHLLLESWGFDVLSARDCDEALLRLSEWACVPDLILADYRLQCGATGAQAINRIRSRLKAALPAIILTGDTAPERLRQAKASGHGLLHKPVQPVMLHQMINEALAQKAVKPDRSPAR